MTVKLDEFSGTDAADTFQYVPLLQGLTSLLQHPQIADEVH